MVPKLQPWVGEYIESEFINNIGLGIFIFIFSLFTIIVIGKSLGRAVTWTWLGSIDKTFGLIFGLFKGYVVSICLFSILNWFYPYTNWGISVENALSFDIVKKGSEMYNYPGIFIRAPKIISYDSSCQLLGFIDNEKIPVL